MDWLPIVLLTLSVSIYFWYRVLAKWWQVVLVILGFISLRVCLYMFLKGSAGINASYFINGVNMFVPALILLAALLFIGFWPRSIADPVNETLEARISANS